MSTQLITVKKRTLAILISFMMVFSVFAVLPAIGNCNVYAAGETGQVKATKLYVRSGAGTNYKSIGSMTKGKTFIVTGTAKDKSGVTWYKLKYNSKNGYVSSKFVNIIKHSVTSLSNTTGTVATKKDPLTIRSGPGSGYSKLGTLAKGKTFSVTGKTKDSSGLVWYLFKFNGKTGYASSKYVTIKQTTPAAPSAPSTPTITEVTNTTGTVTTQSDSLTIRSGPGTSYSKLGTLAKGKTFAVTGKTTDSSGLVWYTFSFNGKTGYASSKYVTVKTNSDTGTSQNPDSSVTVKGKVTTQTNPLTVRTGPGTSYSKAGTLAKGTVFDITGKLQDSTGKWWYALTLNGKVVYASSDYVTLLDENGEENSGADEYEPVTFQIGTVTVSSGCLNVRSGAGSSYTKLGTLSKGAVVTVTGSSKDKNGKVWYEYQFSSSKTGYICSDYVKVTTVTSDKEFEAYMAAQGFPESYKPGLRALHAAHPNWTFKAYKVGCSFSKALSKETATVGTNLVSPSSPVSYRSKDPKSYNSSTGAWTKFDTSWYAASDKVVAHYLDPRNFLDESGIYQFMLHTYDKNWQNANTVAAVVKGTFMETRKPGSGYSSFAVMINDIGKSLGVNPNVIAAMIVQEQGTKGTSGLISGTYSGYKGYYNFFNVGAYASGGKNAIVNGLIYASGSGSYSRPWNSIYKSIYGGTQFYSSGYVLKNQDSYYTKKFNVKNGVNSIGKHQYMTNVAGAYSEGKILKRAAVSDSKYTQVFEIPVYTSMPATPSPLP